MDWSRRRGSNLVTAGVLFLIPYFSSATPVARVFVSVNGNDGNTCSNVATPCRTLSAAIGQVDAGGQVIVLDSGSYAGAAITKGVTINVPPGVIAFSALPVTIDAGPTDVVVIRGLTLHAVVPGPPVGSPQLSYGILFNSGGSLHVERCDLSRWSVGIQFNGPGKLFVEDTVIRNSTYIAIYPEHAGTTVAVYRCLLQDNVYGLASIEDAKSSIRDSVISGNTRPSADGPGLYAGTGGTLDVDNCLVANNDIAVWANTGGTVRVAASTLTGNLVGLRQTTTGVLETYSDNRLRGNGTDVDGTVTPVLTK